jgi:hypothetical protein
MKLKIIDPPREFEVGFDRKLIMKDCAQIELLPDEQVTLLTESGNEYDLARKSWGFYATPSLNGRLQRFKLRAVLVKNRINQFYVMLVEQGKEADFQAYVDGEPLHIVCWMDTKENLQHLEQRLKEDMHE